MKRDGYSFLTMTEGPRAGASFVLDPTEHNRIGRGTDCDVILVDPLCSRVHAEVMLEEDGWWLRDAGSRNGTLLNGKAIELAKLPVGSKLRVGSTEFVMNWSDQPPTMNTSPDNSERIVRQHDCNPTETNIMTSSLRADADPAEVMMLYQLSLKLLATPEPDGVLRAALNILRSRTQSAVVGFLWVNDDEQLTPQIVIPAAAAGRVPLSQTLTEIVCRKARAVWVANQSRHQSPDSYSDAIVVPLIHKRSTLGAIHLYRESGSYTQAAFDFSISLASLLVVALVRAREQATLSAEHRQLINGSASFDVMVGDSDEIHELTATIPRVARTTGCVLIRGESGTGKELVARAIHRASARADRPLLCVNCSAIPHELVESQLFGHAKGAFPAAGSSHRGWFQQADTGTLLLDDVGELPPEAQAKLLRILEGHPFLPLGSDKQVSVDVRLIAVSKNDLRKSVDAGKFREDLYYRLSVFELSVPPLRQRTGDVVLLADYFLDRFRQQYGRPHLKMSNEARERLMVYDWPGNVRQLKNVIDSAVALAKTDTITADDLGLPGQESPSVESLRIDHWEKKLIRAALQKTGGKVEQAAKLLGIGRATLYRKLEEFQLSRDGTDVDPEAASD